MVAVRLVENPGRSSSSSQTKFIEQIQGRGYFGFLPNEQWTPAVNLFETDAAYIVCVDLAGVDKTKIKLEVIDNCVSISGKRAVAVPATSDRQTDRVRVHLMEIDHSSFGRNVELPLDIIATDISAQYRDGMLWIEIPKKR